MANKSRPAQRSTYGFASPIGDQFPSPIIAQRLPTNLDIGYSIGQLWVDQPNNDIYILSSVVAGSASWIPLGGQTGLFPVTPFVVGPVGQAGYQTIQSAINAAAGVGGGTVFVQPGTYTENLILQDGVIIVGGNNDPSGTQTVINGTHTPPSGNLVGFQNVSLSSTTDIIASNAAGACQIFITLCDISIGSGFIYNLPNWDATTIYLSNCTGNGSTDNSVINSTGTTLIFYIDDCYFLFGTTGAQFAGFLKISNSHLFSDWNFNGGANVVVENSHLSGVITLSGTSVFQSSNSLFFDAVNPFVQSSSGALTLNTCTVDGGTNPIAGAGAGVVNLGGVTFPTSNVMPATLTFGTTAVTRSDAGFLTSSPLYAFFASLNTTTGGVTGNNTPYVLGTDPLTIKYNFGSVVTTGGVFTAPIDGVYNLSAQVWFTSATIAAQFLVTIGTNNAGSDSFLNQFNRAASSDDQVIEVHGSVLMQAGDLAFVSVNATGEVANTVEIFGSTVPFSTWFQGNLIV